MNRSFILLLLIIGGVACNPVQINTHATESVSLETPNPPTSTLKTGQFTQSLNHDGLERSYLMYVPETAHAGPPLPLLLNLHGFTGTAESQLEYADFRPIADREGIILVYPLGTLLEGKEGDTHWNVGGWTRASTVDDTGFLSALIDVVSRDFNIDTERVYSIGHSNGGYMSFQLACQIGEKITAIASISGSMTPETFEACAPSHPTPILQIHGTADNVVPYSGASWSKSIDEVLTYWVTFNELDDSPLVTDFPQNPNSTADSQVIHFRFGSLDSPVAVEHMMVDGGGHEWLGQPNGGGKANFDLEPNEEIWAFLSQFTLNELDQ